MREIEKIGSRIPEVAGKQSRATTPAMECSGACDTTLRRLRVETHGGELAGVRTKVRFARMEAAPAQRQGGLSSALRQVRKPPSACPTQFVTAPTLWPSPA